MEEFFRDPKLCLVYRNLSPIISQQGHNISENRKNNRSTNNGHINDHAPLTHE